MHVTHHPPSCLSTLEIMAFLVKESSSSLWALYSYMALTVHWKDKLEAYVTCGHFFWWNVQNSMTREHTHLKCWHLVGLHIKAWIPALVQWPIVWLLLDEKVCFKSFLLGWRGFYHRLQTTHFDISLFFFNKEKKTKKKILTWGFPDVGIVELSPRCIVQQCVKECP